MSAKQYFAANGASPTTAAQVVVSTGTSIKTLLQVATPSTTGITVIEWGISIDNAATSVVKAELLQTDVAATSGTSVTPTVWGDPNAPASLCVGGTGSTCYSPSAEGTITVVREFDVQQLVAPYSYWKQYPLGREVQVPISKFLRVRVTASAAVNAYAYIIWEE